MKKAIIFILSLIIILSYSCEEEEGDKIYLSHKLIIEGQRTSDYYITICWNNLPVNNYENFILVESYEEKGFEFYSELAEALINSDYFEFEQMEWLFECELHNLSANSNSHEVYDWYNSQRFYKLLAFNKNGEFIYSNLIIF